MMFVYLSKKIAIPNNVKLRSVSWNNDQGWIACGGDDGLLKVLKLEGGSAPVNGEKESQQPATTSADGAEKARTNASGSGVVAGKGLTAPSNLSMNQTLEGHSGSVIISTWNIQQKKLTTSDQYGLIIVWILYRGMWYEEMINNRNRSMVADMQWNKDGERICIVYEDGAVIVGSADGNRIWGKELKCQLAFVQWSPDSKNILFATKEGVVQIYDAQGSLMNNVTCYCNDSSGTQKIAAMDWYTGCNGFLEPNIPCLAICYENGRVQIMRGEYDRSPVIIDSSMRNLKMKWNHNGSILALAGTQISRGQQTDGKEVNILQFYDPYGQHLRSLRIPGKSLTSLSWEYSGLRIALAVDSFIYFANVRPDYKWTYFADTLVYAFNRPDRPETCCLFWNGKTGEKFLKYVSKLYFIYSCGDHCLMAAKLDDANDQYIVSVCNAIGTSLESRHIDFEPCYGIITKTHVFVASKDIVVWWQLKGQTGGRSIALEVLRQRDNKEYSFHIDSISSIGSGGTDQPTADLKRKSPSTDQIVSIAATESTFVIARRSGTILQFSIPSVTLDERYTVPFLPQSISINCNSTRLGIIDISGILKIMELRIIGKEKGTTGKTAKAAIAGEASPLLDFERKDVWDMVWADDNPELFAMMEKARMYVIRNLEPEEPIPCNGYIGHFSNLQIKALFLDEIMNHPENPSKEHIDQLETKSLRDTRNILAHVGLPDAVQFVENNPHPRLWRLIGDASLEQLDFAVAQRAFVRCIDYQALQFIKRLQKLDDKIKQKAEIAAYFSRFEEAEKLYLQIDRKDLAIDMRMRLGDWFRVVQLIKAGGGSGDDALIEKSWDEIGDYYFERQRWAQAVTYYVQSRNSEQLAECYYVMEDYDGLEKLIHALPENHSLLKNIAYKFLNIGLCEQTVAAFMKSGDVKLAVDACVQLNRWNTAVELAEKNKLRGIEALFAKYATYLLDRNKRLQAIELYRRANYCQKSAHLLYQLAREAAKEGQSPLRIKKLYVLAALEVERYHELNKHSNGGALGEHGDNTSAALSGLLREDVKSLEDTKFLDNAWGGAEAYHYYMLAQRQYFHGNFIAAVITANILCDYEEFLDPRSIYNLLALSSFHAKAYGTCSKAFVRLEALHEESATEDIDSGFGDIAGGLKDSYEALAFSIFTKYPPVNPKGPQVTCTNCAAQIPDRENTCPNCHITFPTCMVSGQPIVEYHHFMCHTCKHRAIESEISGLSHCPLCHTTL